jgi:hypothetical protein
MPKIVVQLLHFSWCTTLKIRNFDLWIPVNYNNYTESDRMWTSQTQFQGKRLYYSVSHRAISYYFFCIQHRIKIHIYRRATYVGSFEVSVLAHVALRMLAAIFLASQWHFLANKHAVLAGCSAFWPVNCIFLHKKTRTRCTAEWLFCYWSLFCGVQYARYAGYHGFQAGLSQPRVDCNIFIIICSFQYFDAW